MEIRTFDPTRRLTFPRLLFITELPLIFLPLFPLRTRSLARRGGLRVVEIDRRIDGFRR